MKNKKILGALAALCMGVILCVSSVFAVNYWYDITNNDDENTVTMGNALTLTLNDVDDAASHLYPGGYAIFEDITVKGAADWLDAKDSVANVKLPKFALRVKAAACTAADASPLELTPFTVYQNQGGSWVAVATANTLAKDLLILDDLQDKSVDGADIIFDVRIAFAGTAGKEYAQSELTFTLEIVAYVDADDDGYDASEVLIDAVDTPDQDGAGATNSEDALDPLA